MPNLSIREKALITFTLLLTAIAALSPPIAELSGYFHFADQREILGLPQAMDVLSNLPFLLMGLYDIFVLTTPPPKPLKWPTDRFSAGRSSSFPGIV